MVLAPNILSLLDALIAELKLSLNNSEANPKELYNEYLGTRGKFNNLKKNIDWSILSIDNKKLISDALVKYQADAKELIYPSGYQSSDVDLTNYDYNLNYGYFHPLSKTQTIISNFFTKLGFEIIESTDEIESLEFNFDLLNVDNSHPSRRTSDTFYLPENRVLRTHTTAAAMSMKGINNLKHLIIGAVYRKDKDRTHTPMFHQADCIWLNDNINIIDGIKVLIAFINSVLNLKYRIRPSYFPFTEPSFEIDVLYQDKWLEILGGGMYHPIVMNNLKMPNQQAFAFGMGIERIMMIKYNIDDLNDVYNNDLKFLAKNNY